MYASLVSRNARLITHNTPFVRTIPRSRQSTKNCPILTTPSIIQPCHGENLALTRIPGSSFCGNKSYTHTSQQVSRNFFAGHCIAVDTFFGVRGVIGACLPTFTPGKHDDQRDTYLYTLHSCKNQWIGPSFKTHCLSQFPLSPGGQNARSYPLLSLKKKQQRILQS